jgi:hypothetical protein
MRPKVPMKLFFYIKLLLPQSHTNQWNNLNLPANFNGIENMVPKICSKNKGRFNF